MPRRTNEFQELVAEIQKHLDPGATVEESAMLPDRTTGTLREIDICVRGRVATHDVTVSIECRDRGRPADVTWVDEMHTKHSRLPTNLLVLASHSSFTAEAIRVADGYGIRHLALDDIDAAATTRLFPETSSLWGKTWTVEIERVNVIVELPSAGTTENVRAYPDTAIFLETGETIGPSVDVANALVRHEGLNRQLGADAREEHTYVTFGWASPGHEGTRLCLRSETPAELRPIQRFEVTAKCKVTVNEFPLKHGVYGPVRVAWGSGTMLGSGVMVVVTVQENGQSILSLRHASSTAGSPKR